MGDISVRESIRWPPAPASEPTSTVVLTSPERRFVDVRLVLLPGQPAETATALDWAFAGTSSRCPAGRAAAWTHWVDSRAEAMRDEAEVEELAGGAELERGRMVNPETGVEADYEEVWRSVEPVTVTAAAGCVVLQTEDGSRGERGMVIRLGQYCQGILRAGDGVTVERWEWRLEEGWERSARFGEGQLPVSALVGPTGVVEVGGEIEDGGRIWKVVEAT